MLRLYEFELPRFENIDFAVLYVERPFFALYEFFRIFNLSKGFFDLGVFHLPALLPHPA